MTGTVCNKCKGTGWTFTKSDGADYAKPCDCKREKNEIIRGQKGNIPNRFLASIFEYTFMPQNSSDTQITAKNISQNFVRDYPAIDKGLLFQGNVGLGKTQLLCTIGSELIKKNIDIYYIDWNDLTRIMGSGEDAGSRDFGKINKLIRKLVNVELLLFDELGASRVSPWVSDNIYYLINKRYNNNATTLFATNYTDSVSDNKDSLTDRVGDRIRSRLYEMTKLVMIRGTDFRTKT